MTQIVLETFILILHELYICIVGIQVVLLLYASSGASGIVLDAGNGVSQTVANS